MKYLFVDIGELGWSLYIVAWARKLIRDGNEVVVITTRDRMFLYRRITRPLLVPDQFLEKYKDNPQDCFGRLGVSSKEIMDYFHKFVNAYNYHPKFKTGYVDRNTFKDELLWEPFTPYEIDVAKRILVFPRYRTGEHHAQRNLSKEFYEKLILTLCDKYPNYLVTTVGKLSGAYDINVLKDNYSNMVTQEGSLQDLIDMLPNTLFTIGGTSAPPKIAMINSVPTFVVGHELHRFTVEENYMNSNVGFYELEDYQNFNEEECINKVIEWTDVL